MNQVKPFGKRLGKKINEAVDFRELPKEYSHSGGIKYKQVKRSDKAVMYKSISGPETYEVFNIKVKPATTLKIKGKVTDVPDREVLPGNEGFGDWAFMAFDFEKAEQKYNELDR